MNRRSFLKLAGIGGAAAAAAVSLPLFLPPDPSAGYYSTYIMGRDAVTFVNNGEMEPLTLADVRACVEALKSREVKPWNGQFVGWVHPDRAAEVDEWIRYKWNWNYQWTAGNS